MQTAIAFLAAAMTLQASPVVQLVPAGHFQGRDGRPGAGLTWKLPNDKGRALVARMNQRHATVRFNFDYDHQTLASEKNGQPAPAAGWATKFEWRDDQGLFALDAQWTARARQMIEAREYAYISPVIAFNKQTGEVFGVINAALVNIPALDLGPIAHERVEALSAQYAALVGNTSLTDDERAIFRAMGIDEADIIAAREVAHCRAVAESKLTDFELSVCRATGIDAADFLAMRETGQDVDTAEAQLTENELAVCRATGIAPRDFLRAREAL